MAMTTGAAMPTAGLRDHTESRIARQAKPERRGTTLAQLATTSCRAARGDGLPGEAGQRLGADDQHAGDDRGRREQRQHEHGEAGRGDRLGPEQPAAAGRAGQHGLPGAVLVLAGEDVAGDDRGQQRQHPLGGEAEDEQRQREAVLGGEPAEERVLGGPGLAVEDHHDRDRGQQGADQDGARPGLAAQLAQLPAQGGAEAGRRRAGSAAVVRTGGAVSVVVIAVPPAARGTPDAGSVWCEVSSVSMKNRASSGVRVAVKPSSSTSARTSSATYAETWGRAPVTISAPSASRSTRTAGWCPASARACWSSEVWSRWPGSGAMARSSVMVPWKATAPRFMIVTLSQISSTSAMSWELSSTVSPLAASRLTSARMSRMPAGSRPLAGSSSTSSLRLAQQAGRDAEALAHPVGVAADLAVGPVGQVDDLEDLLEQAGPDAAVEEREALEVLPAGQVGVEAWALDEAGDAVQHADAGVGPGPAEDPDRARVGPDQPEQHPQERRLAGAVGPEDAVDLARGHAEGDVVDGADRTRRSW